MPRRLFAPAPPERHQGEQRSDDPERDGRGMAAMVDGLLLDRLSHPGQTHGLLVEAVRRRITA